MQPKVIRYDMKLKIGCVTIFHEFILDTDFLSTGGKEMGCILNCNNGKGDKCLHPFSHSHDQSKLLYIGLHLKFL